MNTLLFQLATTTSSSRIVAKSPPEQAATTAVFCATPVAQTLSLAEAQEQLPRIADQLEQEQRAHGKADPITVTRSGKPTLAILPYEYYESLIETLEVLEDPELMAALREGIAAADRGETVSIDVVRKELGLA